LRIVDVDLGRRTADRDATSIGRPGECGDVAVLPVEFAQQGGIVGDLHDFGTVHQVDVGHSLVTTDDNDILQRMPGDREEFAAQQIDVLEKSAGACVGEFGGAVAAHGD